MPTEKYYKFSITNLALVANNYPFDFFFRIKQNTKGNYLDSQTIDSQTFTCSGDFPWEFSVQQLSLTIQFLEKRHQRPQIVRAVKKIYNPNIESVQQLQMIGNRTGRKLCILQYIIEPDISRSERKGNYPGDHQSREENKKNIGNQLQQNVNKLSEQPNISNQIKQLQKSMQKILGQTKSEHKKFTSYLDKSSKFIQQLVKSQAKDQQSRNNIQNKVKQAANNKIQLNMKPLNKANEEGSEMHNRWFQQKYGKNLNSQSKNLNNISVRNYAGVLEVFQPILQYSQSFVESIQNIQLQDLYLTTTEIKPHSIIFSKPKNPNKSLVDIQQIIVMMKCPLEFGYQWKKIIQIPNTVAICIKIQDYGKKKSAYGFIGEIQAKKKHINLFDDSGKTIGQLKFKCKPVSCLSVQTVDVLNNNRTNSSTTQQNQNSQSNLQYFKDSVLDQKKFKIVEHSTNKEDINKSRENELSESWLNAEEESRSQIFPNAENKICNFFQSKVEKDRTKPQQIKSESQCIYKKNKNLHINSHQIDIQLNQKEKQTPRRHTKSLFLSEMSNSREKSETSFNLLGISIKINMISIKLLNKSDRFSMKFMKISAKGCQPILTECKSLNSPLIWKGNCYILKGIMPFEDLIIDLCTKTEENTIYQGFAKISLTLLTLDKERKVSFYHQYIRDKDMNQIGELIIGYQSIGNKNKIYPSILEANEQMETLTPLKKYQRKKKKIRLSTNPSNLGQSSEHHLKHYKQTPKNRKIGIEKSSPKYFIGQSSSVRTKKYTGGNIIIGRASRFKYKSQQSPGP